LRWDHSAANCYHQFDIRYSGNVPSGNTSSDTSTLPQSNSSQHQALVAEPPHSNSNAPSATWFLDSGATTHVTLDINNLTYTQCYTGNDTVHIGNGTYLSILHTGSATLLTNYHALQLSNVLHVPLITKNLLSVSQLTRDNNIFVEFSHTNCFIKDQATEKTLLHDILHNGLYELQLPYAASHQIFTVSQNTLAV
jgi:hypothetical protein